MYIIYPFALHCPWRMLKEYPGQMSREKHPGRKFRIPLALVLGSYNAALPSNDQTVWGERD